MSSVFSPPRPFIPSPPHPIRIVIPIVAGIGNALLAVPMVRHLKRIRPEAKITVLARIGAMGDVFNRLDEVDEVIVTGKGAKGMARMVLSSRRLKPDVYLVPFPSNRWQYAVLAATSGAKRKILHSYPVGRARAMHFIGDRIAAVRGIHDVQQNLNLLRKLGIKPDAPEPPVFCVTDDDRAVAATMLSAAGLPRDANPIVIHAGSAQTVLARAKRWPAESYAKLIGAIAQEFGNRVVLVEGPDEAGVAREILQSPPIAMGGLSTVVVKLSGPLAHAAALLERADLYVGSDSGLAHLAAAVGTRAVTIFAPADPDRVCPFGNRDLVVQSPTHCAPCMQYPWNATAPAILCREPFCVREVGVDAVMEKVRLALSPLKVATTMAAAP